MQARSLRFPLWAKITTVAVVIMLFVVLLRAMGGLLLPFLWAMVAAYLFSPLVRVLSTRTRTQRFWWVLLIYVVAGFLIYSAFSSLVPRLVKQFNDLQKALPQFANDASRWIEQHGTLRLGTFQFDLRNTEGDLIQRITELASGITVNVPRLLGNVIEALILGLVFLVVTFYLLLQGDRLVESLYSLVPLAYRAEIRELGRSIDRVLGAYIRSQLILIALMSVLTYTALTLLGVRYALILGIATGFLEIIPFVGPYTAGSIAVLVALLQSPVPFGWPNWVLALVVAGMYLVLRQVEDHLIIPNLVGHIVELHPIIVIFSILAGGHIGGGLGLLVAIPVAATLRIILVYLYNKLVDTQAPAALREVHAEADALLDQPRGTDNAATHMVITQTIDAHRLKELQDEPAAR